MILDVLCLLKIVKKRIVIIFNKLSISLKDKKTPPKLFSVYVPKNNKSASTENEYVTIHVKNGC